MRLQLIKKQVTNGITALGDWIAYGGAGGPSPAQFSPMDLFANGEPGFWYDPSDLSTMFQDSAGTIPMQPVGTVADQPVGKILDKSGNNNHATQATSTARPVLSARVNEKASSNTFTDTAQWTHQQITVSPAAAIGVDGAMSASGIIGSTVSGVHSISPAWNTGTQTANVLYSNSIYVKAGAKNFVYVEIFDSSVGQNRLAYVDLTTGVITGTPTPAVITAQAEPNGYWRINAIHTSPIPTSTNWIIYPAPSNSSNIYAGDGVTVDIYVCWAQINRGPIALNYQRVDTASNYNGDPAIFPPFLKFDGVDDSLATASFAMTSTSKTTVFSGYANGKTGSTGTQLEFSANYMNNGGGFALLVPSLSTSNVSFGSHGTLGAGEKDAPTAPAGGLEKRVLTAYQDFGTINDYGCDYIRANGIPLQNLVGVGNTDVGAGPFGTYPAFVGARNGASNFMSGHIYSLTLAGNGYDEETLVKMENWIDAKVHP